MSVWQKKVTIHRRTTRPCSKLTEQTHLFAYSDRCALLYYKAIGEGTSKCFKVTLRYVSSCLHPFCVLQYHQIIHAKRRYIHFDIALGNGQICAKLFGLGFVSAHPYFLPSILLVLDLTVFTSVVACHYLGCALTLHSG